MTGFERLKEQVKDQEDKALVQTVEYLLTREELEQKFLDEGKTLKEMKSFIQDKARKYMKNGWTYITNEVVYSWAIMYFSLPKAFLKIAENKAKKDIKVKENSKNSEPKNNVVSLEKAKKVIKNKKETSQLSLFGGEDDDKG